MIDHESSGWLYEKAAPTLAGVANVAAWAQSLATSSLNAGAIVTFCTIAIPAVVGAIIYIIKNLGPVWLKYLADRDQMRASTLAGQMAQLNQNLAEERKARDASANLATINAKLAEASDRRADELAELVKILTEKVEAGNQRVEDANKKLHAIGNDRQTRELEHAAEKMEAEQKYAELMAKLDAAHAENAGLLDRLARGVEATRAKADRNSARLDGLEGA